MGSADLLPRRVVGKMEIGLRNSILVLVLGRKQKEKLQLKIQKFN